MTFLKVLEKGSIYSGFNVAWIWVFSGIFSQIFIHFPIVRQFVTTRTGELFWAAIFSFISSLIFFICMHYTNLNTLYEKEK